MQDLNALMNSALTEAPLVVEDIKVLSGANYFSGGPVIRFRVNLGSYDEVFTNHIPGFYPTIKAYLPSLHEHFCSVGKKGGFLQRVQNGTLLGHVMEHVAIELQTLAGMDVGFGKTRMTRRQGVYNVVFRFFDEVAGIYAGKSAFNLINCILTQTIFDVDEVVENLKFIRDKRMLGFSTQSIVDAAENRGIPWFRLDHYNRVQLGTGKYRKLIRATITGNTSLIGVETADDKYLTTMLLKGAGVPVPERIITDSVDDALRFFKELKKPVVVKPATGYQGKRVSIDLDSVGKLKKAFAFAKDFNDEVIVQEYIPGNAYRVLVVDHVFVAAVQVLPACITGDGKATISQLIMALNFEEGRETGDKGKLSKYTIDEDTHMILSLKGYDLNSVVPEGETIYLRNSGNLRLGGKAVDVTDMVHPFNRFICERISKTVNLDVAGIDILSEDIALPLSSNKGRVIEVNAAPDLKMHIAPFEGSSRPVNESILTMLFPADVPFRVPVISVTGSSGKEATAGLLEKFFSEEGLAVGHAGSKGLFVKGNCLKEGDMTDRLSEQVLLQDPVCEIIIFETPVETVLNSGIGYGFADFGVVLNIDHQQKDYFTYDHIHSIEDIAYSKSVVAEEVLESGYSVLNADDDLILEMQSRLYSKVILISKDEANVAVREHCDKGGLALVLDGKRIYILNERERTELLNLEEISGGMNKLTDKIYPIMAVSGVLFAMNNPTEKIREFLSANL